METPINSEAIESKIWKILGIFQHENIRVEDHYVGLLFLTLWKSNLLPVAYKGEGTGFYNDLVRAVSESKSANSEKLLAIVASFKSVITRFSQNGLSEIIFELNSLRAQIYSTHFPDLFDYLLYRISNSQGRYGGEMVQPIELTKLLMSLADLPDNASIYNPFAGLASFGVFLEPTQRYFGQELNERTWAIGQLRLIAYEKNQSSNFKHEDSIQNWPNEKQKYDLVISHPPFFNPSLAGKRQGFASNLQVSQTFEFFLFEYGINLLNQSGKLIAVVTQGFLSRGPNEKQLRKRLIDQDLIETIISLPGGILSNTGVSINLIVLTLTKPQPGLLQFINGTKFIRKINRKETILDYEGLTNAITNPNENSNDSKFVSIETIQENNFSLNASRYFIKQVEGVKLLDFLEPLRGKPSNHKIIGKLVKIRDLKEEKVDFNLETSKLEHQEFKASQIREIDESCLLVSTKWKTLKPTWFEYEKESIFLRIGDINAFRIKGTQIEKAYLINELHAEYVQEQLEAYRIDGTIPFIRLSDFLEIKIKLPSLSSQREIVDNLYSENLVFEKEKIESLRKRFNEELGLKQHNIRQHLKNVKDSLDALIDLINQNGGTLNKDDQINPLRNITVEKRFDRMRTSLESVIIEVKNLTNQHSFGEPVLIDIENIISTSIEERSSKGYEIIFTKDEAAFLNLDRERDNFLLKPNTKIDSNIKSNRLQILFSEKDFKELINNVVENAENHGFKNSPKNHKIIFDISLENNFLILTIKNNGHRFPENITNSFGLKGIKAGKTANKGIGVWKIIQAIQHFGHQYEVIDEPEKEFPAGWIFMFKLLND